jgi:hypothetical protein
VLGNINPRRQPLVSILIFLTSALLAPMSAEVKLPQSQESLQPERASQKKILPPELPASAA